MNPSPPGLLSPEHRWRTVALVNFITLMVIVALHQDALCLYPSTDVFLNLLIFIWGGTWLSLVWYVLTNDSTRRTV
jgi:hypothetical protein